MAVYFAGPAQIIIDPTGTPITIDKDEQLGEATISLEKDVFDLMAQSSSRPVDYMQTAAGLSLTISVGDMSQKLELIALAFGATIVTSGAKRKVVVTNNAGAIVGGKPIQIKPYVGDAPSSAANDYLYIYNAKLTDLSGTELTYGLSTQQALVLRFNAVPDAAGNLFTFGDVTA